MLTTIIFLAIITPVFIYILLPLMRQDDKWAVQSSRVDETLAALKEQKEACLRAIKDIEFEYASGKINEEDYRGLKEHYTLKAAELIEEIERRTGGRSSAA